MTSELWEIGYPDRQARRVITDLNSYHGAGLTADGSTLVTQLNESSFNLWTLSLEDAADAERITSGTKNSYDSLAWTPDGRIVHDSNAGGNLDIWVMNADGSSATQLTADQQLNGASTVTADGKYVVFLSNREGTVNIWRMDLEGGNPVQLTQGELDVDPDVSPDGQWVVYLQPGSGRIYKVSIEGGESTELRDRRSGTPQISPDGTRILLNTYYEDEERWKLDIIPFDGGDPIRTIDERDIGSVQWARDGKALTYVDYEGDVGNIWSLPLDGGDPVQLTHFDSDGIQSYAWSDDGRQLVLSRGHSTQDIVLLKNFR
jgi:TolB protein